MLVEALHALQALEIVVHESLCLGQGDGEFPGKFLGTHAVEQTEVDGLGLAALLGGDPVNGHVEQNGRGGGVHVFVAGKSVEQSLVTGKMGEHAQFDLRVVRGHQEAPGSGNETGTHARAESAADGNVLHVGVAAGKAAGGGARLVEGGVQALVFVGHAGQRIEVGGAQLFQHTKFQDEGDERMLVAQRLQHFVGRGGRTARGFSPGGNPQFGEEQIAELSAGTDVHRPARMLFNGCGELVQAVPHLVQEGGKGVQVDAYARLLHVDEHGNQGQLEPVGKVGKARIRQSLGQKIAQFQGGQGGILRPGLKHGAVATQEVVKFVSALLGIKQIGREGQIEPVADGDLPYLWQALQNVLERRRNKGAGPAQGLDQGRGFAGPRIFFAFAGQHPGVLFRTEGHGFSGKGGGDEQPTARPDRGCGRFRAFGVVARLGKFPGQGAEFVFGEEVEQPGRVRGCATKVVQRDLRTDVGAQAGQPAVVEDLFDVGRNLLLLGGSEAVHVFGKGFQGGIVLHEGEGGFGADAGDARDVVAAVADQGLVVGPLVGGEARFPGEGFQGGQLFRFQAGVPQEHIPVEALPQILVRTHYDHGAFAFVRGGQGGDAVVGLHAVGHAGGQTEEAAEFEQGRDLGRELFGGRGALGLVGGIDGAAEGGSPAVEEEQGEAGLLFPQQLEQHAGKDEQGVRGESVGAFEIRKGVEGAVEKGGAVDQIKRRSIAAKLVGEGHVSLRLCGFRAPAQRRGSADGPGRHVRRTWCRGVRTGRGSVVPRENGGDRDR